MKNSGAQSYSLGAPGYRAPVRQQPCSSLNGFSGKINLTKVLDFLSAFRIYKKLHVI